MGPELRMSKGRDSWLKGFRRVAQAEGVEVERLMG